MSYIGNQPALSYTSFTKQDFSTSATTSYTLDNPVANANELALFINFVRQEPTTAYSASGTTLTLTSATSSSDDMYCVYLGKAVQTVNPPNASVGASQIVDASITSGKLASGVLPTNTPAFEATISANQNITDSSNSKVNFNSENFDTNGCYDHTTNYRFTPTVAGKYYVYSNLFLDSSGGEDIDRIFAIIYKNGSTAVQSGFRQEHDFVFKSQPIRAIIDMNGSSDYLEMYAFVNTISGTPFVRTDTVNDTIFGAYKIIE